jgi:hypothetical protein
MRFQWVGASLAAALMLLAGSAQAHELSCEKTVNGASFATVSRFPATVVWQVTITNTHPTATSVALLAKDSLFPQLDFAAPLSIPVGQSVSGTYSQTIISYEACEDLAEDDQLKDLFVDNHYRVVWDGGEAQCSARLRCRDEMQSAQAGATRTLGFFKTHVQALEACIDKGPVKLGFVSVDSTATALGLLWASPSTYSFPFNKTRRSDLDKARFLLARQTLVGTCNVRLFGSLPTPSDLLDDAAAALVGHDCALMLQLEPLVDGFNNSGDDQPFPQGFVPGPATPGEARDRALDPTLPSGESCLGSNQ